MNRSFVSATIIYVLLMAPAWAEEPKADAAKKAPSININVDPKVSERNKAYDAAVAKLTPEQKETLKKYDSAGAPAAELEVGIMKTVAEARFCAGKDGTGIAKEKPKYQAALGLYASKQQAESRAMLAKVAADRAAETSSFIDPQLAEDHARFMHNLMRALAGQMTKLAEENKGFDKTDCAAVQAKLDAVLAEAGSEQAAGPAAADVAARVAELQAQVEKGVPDAEATLGMLYLGGQGVEKDTKKGLELLQKSAERGYDRAQFLLGLALATDMLGLPPDREKAKMWLGKAAAQGNKKAEQLLATIDKQPPSLTPEELQKKAEAGDAAAQYQLGSRYLSGLGSYPKKPEEGMKWLQMSAGQGDPLAQSDLGLLLVNSGKTDEGLVWMTKAAQAGVTNSQYQLGVIYADGRITPKDAKQAAYWLGKAAEGGDSRAKALLKPAPQ